MYVISIKYTRRCVRHQFKQQVPVLVDILKVAFVFDDMFSSPA